MNITKTVLHGVKVLDLSRVLSGPWCTQTLGDLGADVVKVERPPLGDDARRYGFKLPDAKGSDAGNSTFYQACNRNKRSVALDIAVPAHAALVRAIAMKADVLVENFKVGTLARYGLDYASLKEANPRLIYCSITGFGQDGPYAERPAYDFIMQGMSGLMSTCGDAGEPMRTAVPMTDLLAGNSAATAILAAIIQRTSTGEGQFLDIAMLDVAVNFNSHIAQTYLATETIPDRLGNLNPVIAPSELFQTQDGWIIISAATSLQFTALATLVQQPELVDDARFCGNRDRVIHRTALHERIERVTITQTTGWWVEQFSRAGVPAGPINTLADVFSDPQVAHRKLVVTVQDTAGKNHSLLRSPLGMGSADVDYRLPPSMGQHTDEVLAEWLEGVS